MMSVLRALEKSMDKLFLDTNLLLDVEDGFQLEAALHWGAIHFLTRNVKDFPANSPLIIQTPAAVF